MKPVLSEILIENSELEKWSKSKPLSVRIAEFLAKVLPRGKSFIPRLIGRVFCRDARAAIVTASGAKLAIDPLNLDIYTCINNQNGQWDPHVLNACKSVLEPTDTFYDIGANAGFLTIEAAKYLTQLNQEQQGQVIAFEPQARLAKTIAISTALNQLENAKIYSTMLGSSSGTASLFVPSHSVHASAISREANAKEIKCEVCTIDQLIGENIIIPPNLIKIDVEGGELDVFKGCTETLEKYKPFLIFESDQNMQRFGYGRKELLEFLNQCAAYQYYYIGTNSFVEVDPDIESEEYADILAVPPGKQLKSLQYLKK